jgi:transcriptional regulator with GAF, ATPase, and Fis domain
VVNPANPVFGSGKIADRGPGPSGPRLRLIADPRADAILAPQSERGGRENGRRVPTGLDLTELYRVVAAFARSARGEADLRPFFAGVAAQVRELIPHDRLMLAYLEEQSRMLSVFGEHVGRVPPRHEGHYTFACDLGRRYTADEIGHARVFAGQPELVRDYRPAPLGGEAEANAPCPLTAGLRAWLALPLGDRQHVSGALILGSFAPGVYTEADLQVGQQIAELIGPLLESVALLHTERQHRRRLAVLPEVARVVGTSLNVGEIFDQLGAAVRPVLDFDLMIARLIGPGGTFEGDVLRVSDQPEVLPPDDGPEAYSFCPRILLAREPVLIREARVELDPGRPGDRAALEGGARSILAVPLIFGERVGGVLAFAKRQPDWFDEGDVEVATGIAAHVVVAVQHQRLAEEQRRLAAVEGRARQLEQRVERLRGVLGEQYRFERIVGRAPSFQVALDQAARVAPAETTVLLTGESGTGKELFARAIHHASRRAEGPFVGVNCAALPETLIESELFGHERGAFTGADKLKRGRFELAAGGTLFLDEIGELTPAVQAKLLRVLQERQYERVGGTTTLSADVRLMTATNRDPEQAVADGRLREDLYYRLAVFRVHLPALRQREDDVLLLAGHFLRELAGRMGRAEAGLSREARDLLLAHSWPGNIRELQNAIERALILADGGLISAAHLGIVERPPDAAALPLGSPTETSPPAVQPLAEVEKQSILEALRRAKGNKSRAAAALGLGRTALYTRLRRFGLSA